MPGSTEGQPPSTETNAAISASPAPASRMPVVIVERAPARTAGFGARPEDALLATAIGISGTAVLLLGNRRIRVETNQAAEFPAMPPRAIGAEGGPCEILGIFDRDARRGHRTEKEPGGTS